jgi:large subunit ribosomal protein L5e
LDLTLFFLSRYNPKKLTYEQRKASLVQRLNALNSSGGADDDEDDE